MLQIFVNLPRGKQDHAPFALALAPQDVPVMAASAHEKVMHLQARHVPVKADLFAGQPLNQPVYWQGPMAMASPEALAAAVTTYRRGDIGSL